MEFFLSIAVLFSFFILRIIGSKNSSNLCSIIIKTFGPLTKYQNRAKINLNLIFPKISVYKKNKILSGMWDNIGRNIGELVHLNNFDPYQEGTSNEIQGQDILKKIIKKNNLANKGIIFFSAHIANWEVGPLTLTKKYLRPLCIYRRSNNIFLEKIIQSMRKNIADYAPKGSYGAKKIFSTLKKGNSIAILIDQKLNEGIPVDFLGIPAHTAPAIAQLAIKYKLDLVPVRFERKAAMKFKITYYKPLKFPPINLSHEKKIYYLLKSINNTISQWIIDKPEQWLWIHRRWPNKYYKK